MNHPHTVITISHQLGSGGSQLGQKLSERLGIPFVDRDILQKVAEQLHLAEATLEGREERLSTFWQSMMRMAVFTDPVECMSLDSYEPTDRELFNLESEYILRIAEQSPAVFLGRCGWHILRGHPGRISLLVHADLPDRVRRVQQLYCLDEDKAKKLIEKNDRERTAFVRAFTHQDWFDARWYELCFNTSRLDLDHIVEICLDVFKEKLLVK